MKQFLVLIFSLLLYAGCVSEKMEEQHTRVEVRLVFPESMPEVLADIPVSLQNENGLQYHSVTDSTGVASFDVEYGFYTASSQYRSKKENIVSVYNGSSDLIRVLTPGIMESKLTYTVSRVSQLVFSEIYYTCCVGNDGKSYLKDQYVKIYNNSSETAYLDSICIGFIDPLNATSTSSWIGRPYIPVYSFAWMFPGSGSELPLAPGEEVVISYNAINHVALGHTNSVDLSKPGYWAMYSLSCNLTKQSVPAPGVRSMTSLWHQGNATTALGSCKNPGWIMWKIKDMNSATFLNTSIVRHPVNTTQTTYLAVPTEWIYDGVDCFEKTSNNKRLPSEVDNSYALIPEGIASGFSVHRKIDDELSTDGRLVFRDTNNSSADFVKQLPSLKENIHESAR